MMANWLLVCVCALPAQAGSTAGTGGLHWESDLDAAQQAAKKTGRLVLIHFGGPWCEPCQRLEQQVFSQPGFGKDLEGKYVAVKVDPHANRGLAEKYGINRVPTDVVITATGQLVYKVGSPPTVAAYTETMNRIAANVLPPEPLAAKPPSTGSSQLAGQPAAQTADRYASYERRQQPSAPASEPNGPAAPRELTGESAAAGNGAMQAKVDSPAAKQPPPLALDGYCAVALVEHRQWLKGDAKFGAIHRGRTYLFANGEAQKAFLANPDRYTPVFSGYDPVLRLDQKQNIVGKREHGAFYNNRIYLFASEETFGKFNREPNRYAVEVRQAMRR